MMKENIKNAKKCVFCRYWDGEKACRSRQPNYWEFSNSKGNCIKHRLDNVNASHYCRDFELNSIEYFET